MSHNNGGMTTFGEKIILKSKDKKSPPNDDEGDVGGLNCTPCLVKQLIIISISLESCVTSIMNLKL
jgi:hypothetical protein